MSIVRTISTFFLVILSGCASLSSEKFSEANRDGLRYFLPRSDLLLTINTKSKKVEGVTIATTELYPDLAQAYILKHERSAIAKTGIDIGINEKGLLVSSTASTTSKLTEAFKDLAGVIGMASVQKSVPKGATPMDCTDDGANTFRIDFVVAVAGLPKVCGLDIVVSQTTSSGISDLSYESSKSASGIYYRQNVFYLVTAKGTTVSTAKIVGSPTQSPTAFLPISKSLFTDVTTTMSFKDGIPDKFKQDADGELVAILKLPAQVLSAYFTAIGDTFSKIGTRESQEISAMNSELKLEIAKIKYEACLAAIKANDNDKIKSLNCGT